MLMHIGHQEWRDNHHATGAEIHGCFGGMHSFACCAVNVLLLTVQNKPGIVYIKPCKVYRSRCQCELALQYQIIQQFKKQTNNGN